MLREDAAVGLGYVHSESERAHPGQTVVVFGAILLRVCRSCTTCWPMIMVWV